MEDLNLHNLFFAETSIAVVLTIFIYIRLRYKHRIYNNFSHTISSLKKRELPIFYSSYYQKQNSFRRFFHIPLSLYGRLTDIATRHLAKASKIIQQKLRQNPNDWQLKLLYAEICLLTNDRTSFQHIIEHLHIPFYAPTALKALKLHLSAHNELYSTDMLTASALCSKAIKLYGKKGFTYEQGACYLTLSQIYRISGISDVAFTMLQEAQKLYSSLDIKSKIAEIQAYLGILELGRENYTTAIQYLKTAEEICTQSNLPQTHIHIINWKALIYFLQNDLSIAQKLFISAYKKSTSVATKAFSAEMLARLYFKKQNFSNSEHYANSALLLNQKLHNYAGIFETLYLKAEIYYANNDYTASADILNSLIKQRHSSQTIYYPANAYTLLGLIRLKQNNLDSAETLFKQAIDLENSKNRLKGAAIDYNNLAETARLRGQYDAARQYLQQALTYAQNIQDQDLENLLTSKLETYSS